MNLTQFLLLKIFIFYYISVYSQEKSVERIKDTFFVELGGNAMFYSANYDRIILEKPDWMISGRIGITYYQFKWVSEPIITGIPIEFSFLKGKMKNFLELGIGLTPGYETYLQSLSSSKREEIRWLLLPTRIGYRYQQRDGGLFVRLGFTPTFLLSFEEAESYNINFIPWGGLSIGITLNKLFLLKQLYERT